MTMCAYGNCQNFVRDGKHAFSVTVTHNATNAKSAARFCCAVHAALWLDKWARRRPESEPVAELRQTGVIV